VKCLKATFVATVLFVGLMVGTVQSAVAQSSTCDSSFGAKVPVLMVHGFNSNPEVWTKPESTSMENALKTVEGVYILRGFDYSTVHDQWVTDDNIGPKLARTIDCLAQASLKGGGKGKVIVVAHSMGGLAARFAASQTVNGRKVASEIGLVVTLGTPHLGSLLANAGTELATSACRVAVGNLTFSPLLGALVTKEQCLLNFAIRGLSKDSKELKELAPFPPNIPVRAIAGDARAYVSLLFTELMVETNGDTAVGKTSATAESSNTGKGGGTFVFRCDAYPHGLVWQGDCTHNELPKSSYIQGLVRKGIEEYLASTRTPAVPMTNFFGLQLPLGPEWEVLKSPDDPYSSDRKIVIDKRSCGAQDYRPYCSGFVVAKMGGADSKLPYKTGETCNYDQVHDDLGWSPPKVVGTVTVDGATGEHFTQKNVCKLEDGAGISRQGDTLHGWRFPSKGVMVYDSEGTDSFNAGPLPGLERLLQNATWK